MEVTAKRASTSKGRDTMARTTNIYNPDGTLASAADSLDNDGAPRSLRQVRLQQRCLDRNNLKPSFVGCSDIKTFGREMLNTVCGV